MTSEAEVDGPSRSGHWTTASAAHPSGLVTPKHLHQVLVDLGYDYTDENVSHPLADETDAAARTLVPVRAGFLRIHLRQSSPGVIRSSA